ncbi:MAG: inositol 2-dehydrogenase [Hyphomonas sp.]|nr:inositol 2-dehydrogenase [Hyphomonas sp.]
MHNIALIGAGRIGQIHAQNVFLNSRLHLKSVVDPYEPAASQIADRWGAEVSTISAALADSEIDGVVIASATQTHLEYMIAAANAGKAIFCEKPVDLDLARALTAEQQLSSANVLIGFNRRFDPNFMALKSGLDNSRIGNLETVQITSNDPAPPPAEYIAGSGGLFKDMAIHDFDMSRWLIEEDAIEVYATGSCLTDPAIAEAGDIDTARVILRYPSGRICVIANSRRSGFGYDQRIEAFGSSGLLHVDNVRENHLRWASPEGEQISSVQDFFLDRYREAYIIEMDHFADVLSGERPRITYTDGVAALKLAEAAGRSLQAGTPIKM